MKNIGLFGGTFNPIHNTHLKLADAFCKQADLDSCFFIPANISPTKRGDISINEVSNKHRIEMLKIAIRNRKKFKLDTYEIKRGGISYTINTILNYREKYQKSQIHLLIGSDQFNDFKSWKRWKEILSLVTLCIAERPGSEINSNLIEEFKQYLCCEIKKIFFEKSEISSTIIREKIKKGEIIKNYVPHEVENYIRKNNLYLD
jgi:nicotinate-nucleotide adenylyltransferase